MPEGEVDKVSKKVVEVKGSKRINRGFIQWTNNADSVPALLVYAHNAPMHDLISAGGQNRSGVATWLGCKGWEVNEEFGDYAQRA